MPGPAALNDIFDEPEQSRAARSSETESRELVPSTRTESFDRETERGSSTAIVTLLRISVSSEFEIASPYVVDDPPTITPVSSASGEFTPLHSKS
jgi:hypothetical protein